MQPPTKHSSFTCNAVGSICVEFSARGNGAAAPLKQVCWTDSDPNGDVITEPLRSHIGCV